MRISTIRMLFVQTEASTWFIFINSSRFPKLIYSLNILNIELLNKRKLSNLKWIFDQIFISRWARWQANIICSQFACTRVRMKKKTFLYWIESKEETNTILNNKKSIFLMRWERFESFYRSKWNLNHHIKLSKIYIMIIMVEETTESPSWNDFKFKRNH